PSATAFGLRLLCAQPWRPLAGARDARTRRRPWACARSALRPSHSRFIGLQQPDVRTRVGTPTAPTRGAPTLACRPTTSSNGTAAPRIPISLRQQPLVARPSPLAPLKHVDRVHIDDDP